MYKLFLVKFLEKRATTAVEGERHGSHRLRDPYEGRKRTSLSPRRQKGKNGKGISRAD